MIVETDFTYNDRYMQSNWFVVTVNAKFDYIIYITRMAVLSEDTIESGNDFSTFVGHNYNCTISP